MNIACPSCRTPVAASDIDAATGLARCRVCNNRFSCATAPTVGSAPPRRSVPVGKPRNVVMSESNGELTITWRWYSPKYFVTALICLIWFCLLAVVYGVAITDRNTFVLVLGALHVALGALMAYGTLGGFLNTTTIRIDGNRLSVRHRPLPWPGNVDYPIAQVRQLYCQQTINRRRSGTYYSYDLRALLHDGTRKTVISGLDSPNLPLFLEQHAEAWMRITDVPVAGEMARG